MDNRNYNLLHKKFINKKEYIKFINDLDIINCRKVYLIKKYNEKHTIFPKTNNLFKTFISTAKKENNLFQLFKLQLLLEHFMSTNLLKSLNKLYFDNIDKTIDDYQIFDYIIDKINNNNKIYKKRTCPKWDFILYNVITDYKKIIKKSDNIKYLDIGCGDLKKTLKIKKFLNLKKENVHGTDLKTWGPYKENKFNLNINFEFIVNNKLNYDDNTFDLITCIYTLHHVEKLELFLKEINRVLKKNGRLILIEHDVVSDYDRIIIVLEHLLYITIFEKITKNYIKKRDYMLLFNKNEWDFLLKKQGFKFEIYNMINTEDAYNINYNNSYYAIYKKI